MISITYEHLSRPVTRLLQVFFNWDLSELCLRPSRLVAVATFWCEKNRRLNPKLEKSDDASDWEE
jgi:hypothetical protein